MPKAASTDVLFLNWRDATHPEGGGSERYVHRVAEGLAATGLRVTLLCAAHGRAPREEWVGGVRVLRRGGRLTVYPHGLLQLVRLRPRAVVDVQNGVPFGSPLVARSGVVVLVHHVHREQWRILFGRVVGGLGWWLESRVAPRLYRRCRYVTVSPSTADELVGLGVARRRITVVPNGRDATPAVDTGTDPHPRLVVLGRLVPHKRVEHAIEVVARLRGHRPDLRLDVVGDGWWAPRLRERAAELGVADRVRFHGHVDERTKHELLAAAWLHLCPSVKEGWGIVITEAAGHGVPTVAYRSAGGVRDSVLDGRTGLLVDDLDGMVAAVDGLLGDPSVRGALGTAAAREAARHTWAESIGGFAAVLSRVTGAAPARDAAHGPGSALTVVDLGDRLALRRGLVGVQRRARGEHGRDPENCSESHRDDYPSDRLHALSRLPRFRRAQTVTRSAALDNASDRNPNPPVTPVVTTAAATTATSATPCAPSTAATAAGAAEDGATAPGTRSRTSQ
ncbi:glycosyltransferase family 4 protein [Pseudonocardia lacus]|uniref:glycosyltransferase family 4 protein n=1 Tax=Pseudonocardia lacus TaxID=2835865 RepID=UPI0020276F20|nr:glycosyltransferase family 4 protein [Pseudonocardia lacus]